MQEAAPLIPPAPDAPSLVFSPSLSPSGENYADCDGAYAQDPIRQLNGRPLYLNLAKSRFLGWSGSDRGEGSWVITGTQWLNELLQSQGRSFGGFHANDGSDNPWLGWASYAVERLHWPGDPEVCTRHGLRWRCQRLNRALVGRTLPVATDGIGETMSFEMSQSSESVS